VESAPVRAEAELAAVALVPFDAWLGWVPPAGLAVLLAWLAVLVAGLAVLVAWLAVLVAGELVAAPLLSGARPQVSQ
jgi:uncharacterized membrane protein